MPTAEQLRKRAVKKLTRLVRQQLGRCRWCGREIVSLRELKSLESQDRIEILRVHCETVKWIDESGRLHAAERATVDHVLELSKGGTNRLSNLVAACRACNGNRSATPPQRPRGDCDCGVTFMPTKRGGLVKRCCTCRTGFYAMPLLLGMIPGGRIRNHTEALKAMRRAG